MMMLNSHFFCPRLMDKNGLDGSYNLPYLETLTKEDKDVTPWETERKKLRTAHLLYEQDCIIKEVEDDIKNLDEDISNLSETKLEIDLDCKLLNLFILTVHQEVLILKRYEKTEREKSDRVSASSSSSLHQTLDCRSTV